MKVVVAGGHGQIALALERLLAEAGHQPVGIIRKPEQAEDLGRISSQALVLDLEHAAVDDLAGHLKGVDAVVFATGDYDPGRGRWPHPRGLRRSELALRGVQR